jgi:hypothetical protein
LRQIGIILIIFMSNGGERIGRERAERGASRNRVHPWTPLAFR